MHRRAKWERLFQPHEDCQDLTFFFDQKRRNVEKKKEIMCSKSKGN